jgi:hypothetical protein
LWEIETVYCGWSQWVLGCTHLQKQTPILCQGWADALLTSRIMKKSSTAKQLYHVTLLIKHIRMTVKIFYSPSNLCMRVSWPLIDFYAVSKTTQNCGDISPPDCQNDTQVRQLGHSPLPPLMMSSVWILSLLSNMSKPMNILITLLKILTTF